MIIRYITILVIPDDPVYVQQRLISILLHLIDDVEGIRGNWMTPTAGRPRESSSS